MLKTTKYPIYIVSKGRWDRRLTAESLDRMNLSYYMVVEGSEYDKYKPFIKNLLVLPQKYLDNYDTCDNLGSTKSKGPGAARNFCWDHSILNGFERHWVLDDNIWRFYRLNKNKKIRVESSGIFRASEDFVDRYENIAIAGFDYSFFCNERGEKYPYCLNTRIYSCLLIKNNINYRWRARYNEDTDLSLRVLKDGLCTLQFNAFMQRKAETQTIQGGNTKEFYSNEGTTNKTKMLVDLHPDVTRMTTKFGRCHHTVNYRPFSKNKLILKNDIQINGNVNEYGMVLIN